jgi:chromosome segregation protein
MTELASVRRAIGSQFHNLIEVEDGVLRGERIFNGKCYAIAFFDFIDDVIGRARELRSFQERLIGGEYFDSPEQLRWSSYLYVLAGPHSIQNDAFSEAKAAIEADRDYTRKFVLSAADMLSLLRNSPLFSAENDVKMTDVTSTWAHHLEAYQLNTLLDKPARSKAIELIEKGKGSRTVSTPRTYELNTKDMKLTTGFLRCLHVKAFRAVHDGENFCFADVNLIVGPNGSGKTSLLEAIEYLYCGHNRRDGAHGSYSLSGMIQPAMSDKLESVVATTDISRLKARNFVWYRKENHQAKSILDGFTKYNFLDTDAAFRLSIELEPIALKDDLHRLLIGSDAAMLWDYLEKVTENLDSRAKELRREISFKTAQCEILKKEVERLLKSPSQASTLSKTFRAALRELGWTGKEAYIDEVVNENERVKLEALADSVKRIHAVMGTASVTARSLRDRLRAMTRLRASTILVESRRERIADDLAKKTAELNQTEQTSALLIEWSTYCGADAPRLIRAINNGRDDVQRYQKQLGPLASTVSPRLPEEYADLKLDDVAGIVGAHLSIARGEVRTAEIAQRNIESLQQSLSLLQRQLQEAARQIVANTAQKGVCPVCNTSHSPETLNLKIEALGGVETKPEVAELALTIQTAKSREAGLVQLQDDVTTLRKIAASLDLNPSVTSAIKIQDLFIRQRKKLTDSVESLRRATEAVGNFDVIGISQARYMELRRLIEARFEEDDDIESLAVLDSAKQELASKASAIRQQLLQLNEAMKDVFNEIQELLRRTSLISDSSDSIDVYKPLKSIDEQLQQIQHAEALFTDIRQLIELNDDQSMSDLEVGIISATEAFDRAWHAVSSELTANHILVKAKRDYEISFADLKNKKEGLQRLKEAHTALKTLRIEHSLSAATDTILTTIQDQINDVFGRIHSPREY